MNGMGNVSTALSSAKPNSGHNSSANCEIKCFADDADDDVEGIPDSTADSTADSCEPIEKRRRADCDFEHDYCKLDDNYLIACDHISEHLARESSDELLTTVASMQVSSDAHQSRTETVDPMTELSLEKNFDLIEDCHTSVLQIRALMSIEELKVLYPSLGENTDWDYESDDNESYGKKKGKRADEYEVESIYDSVDEQALYLVKWKNWNEEYNSWEPLSNLSNCVDLIKEFTHIKKKCAHLPDVMQTYRDFHRLKGIIEDLSYKSTDSGVVLTLLLKFCNISVKEFCYSQAEMHRLRRDIEDKCNAIFDRLSKENIKTRISMMTEAFNDLIKLLRICQNFHSISQFFSFYESRKPLQYKLYKWERDINGIIKAEKEGELIRVENFVDLMVPPSDFNYITAYKTFDKSITVCDDPPIYCDCGDCETELDTCCVSIHETPIVYTKNGILRINQRKAIYECNKKCKCSSKCINRVIQNGRKHKLAIFRTDDGKGWGVRTLERIPKGSFVMEYIGEIITLEEADKRGRIYDAEGRTYLFDLDYMPDDESDQYNYVVDATKCGNVSHFVNHSCDPNLDSKVAWINNLDPFMPHIALFAVRNIKCHEELTFDYKINVHGITDNKESVEDVSNDFMQSGLALGDDALGKHSYSYANDKNKINNFYDTGDSDDSGISHMTNDKCDSKMDKSNNIANTSTGNEKKLIRVECKCGSHNCRKYLY